MLIVSPTVKPATCNCPLRIQARSRLAGASSGALVMPLTVTVAVPLFVPSNTDVAVTISVVAFSFSATVSKPEAFIFVAGSVLPLMLHVTVSDASPCVVTFAVNCCESPFCTVAVLGTMTTETTAGGIDGAVTVTVAVLLVAVAVCAPFTAVLVLVTVT